MRPFAVLQTAFVLIFVLSVDVRFTNSGLLYLVIMPLLSAQERMLEPAVGGIDAVSRTITPNQTQQVSYMVQGIAPDPFAADGAAYITLYSVCADNGLGDLTFSVNGADPLPCGKIFEKSILVDEATGVITVSRHAGGPPQDYILVALAEPITAPLAPNDEPEAYSLNPALNDTISVADAVSYPGGDRMDTVSYAPSGLAPGVQANLTITAACEGSLTEQVRFTRDDQTFGCNDTIVSETVTSATPAATIEVAALDGKGVYVEWELTARLVGDECTGQGPIAPDDPRFNNPLTIPLDSTASVTDFVSYPCGDQEDRVRWNITGMNPNPSLSGGRARLVLAVSCFGSGTNQLQIFTAGQTYACGQTILDREVTYDSRTGQATITATGNSYVQWVLTGTATRVN